MRILQNLKKKKTTTDDYGVPLDGGNFYNVEQLLNAQKELNLATIPKEINTNFNDESDYYDIYRLLLFQGNYFINRFNIILEDKDIQAKVYEAMWGGFLYGRGGIVKLNGEYMAFAVNEISYNAFGVLESLTVIPSKFYIGNESYKDIKKYKKVIINIPSHFLSDVAIYQWNNFAQSAYFRLLPFLRQYKYWIELINSQKYLHLTKIIYEINDPSTLTDELKQFKNPRKPFLAFLSTTSKSNKGALANKLQVLELNKSFTNQLKEDYLLWKSEFYELLGREFLQDPKAERKIEAEVEQSNASFSSNEYDYFLQVDKFLFQLKKIGIIGEVGNYVINKEDINDNEDNTSANNEEDNNHEI